jgi:hypothetical protein
MRGVCTPLCQSSKCAQAKSVRGMEVLKAAAGGDGGFWHCRVDVWRWSQCRKNAAGVWWLVGMSGCWSECGC